jgi:hypothetical protein
MKNITLFLLLGLFVLLSGCSYPKVWVEGEVTNSPMIMPMYDKKWVLVEDLEFTFWDEKKPQKEYKITVPAGFVMDLASIPAGPNVIFSNYGQYATAGIIHDFLYWTNPDCKGEGDGRRIADKLYRDVMEIYNVSRSVRWAQYFGLWLWGQHAWDKNKKLRESGESRYLARKYWKHVNPSAKWSKLKKDYATKQACWEKETNETDCRIEKENICGIKTYKKIDN